MIAIDKDITGTSRAFGDFEEEPIIARPQLIRGERVSDMTNPFNPVIDEHPIHIADIIPDAVRIRKIDHQIIPACGTIALIEDFHGRRVISGNVLNIISHKDVVFKQRIVRADNVDPFRAGIAYPAMTNRQMISPKVARDPGAVGYGTVFQRRAYDILSMAGLVGQTLRVSSLNFERTVGILCECDSTNSITFAI